MDQFKSLFGIYSQSYCQRKIEELVKDSLKYVRYNQLDQRSMIQLLSNKELYDKYVSILENQALSRQELFDQHILSVNEFPDLKKYYVDFMISPNDKIYQKFIKSKPDIKKNDVIDMIDRCYRKNKNQFCFNRLDSIIDYYKQNNVVSNDDTSDIIGKNMISVRHDFTFKEPDATRYIDGIYSKFSLRDFDKFKYLLEDSHKCQSNEKLYCVQKILRLTEGLGEVHVSGKEKSELINRLLINQKMPVSMIDQFMKRLHLQSFDATKSLAYLMDDHHYYQATFLLHEHQIDFSNLSFLTTSPSLMKAIVSKMEKELGIRETQKILMNKNALLHAWDMKQILCKEGAIKKCHYEWNDYIDFLDKYKLSKTDS